MDKLVILELDGDLTAGLRVSLDIGDDGESPTGFLRLKGRLPAAPELAQALQTHWSDNYRNLNAPYRIQPKRIVLHSSLAACRESAGDLRDRLNTWLDSPDFRPLDKRLRQELDREDDIRLLVRTSNLELQKLPWTDWELLHSYPRAEPGFAPLEAKIPLLERSLPNRVKVRILAILGHDEGIDIERDRRCLATLPAAAPQFLVKPTRREVIEQLHAQPWDIIFFAGHSETEGETGRIHLNPDESLSVDELWYSLRKAVDRGLQLAIFNSCDGLGLAQRLDELAIPQMIVMRELIPDRVAQSFLVSFLQNFAAGLPLYVAVREARQRLHDEWDSEFPCTSWLPVICQGAGLPPPTWEELQAPAATVSASSAIEPPALARQRPRWHPFVPILSIILATSLMVSLRELGWLQPLEIAAFDALNRHRPAESVDRRFLLITIGERDKQYQQQQGMERRESLSPEALALLWEKLAPHQPRLLGINIRDFKLDPALNIAALRDRRIIATCQTFNPAEDLDAVPPPNGFTGNRIGFSNIVTDSDDVVRRQVLGHRSDAVCASDRAFSLRLVERYLGIAMQPEQQRLDALFLPRLTPRAGNYSLEPSATSSYQTLIHYRNAEWTQVNLARLLSGELDSQLPALARDRIILLGGDRHAPSAKIIPLQPDKTVPSIVVHANMSSQLISAIQDSRPLWRWWQEWVEILWIATWAAAGSVSLLPRHRLWQVTAIAIGSLSLGFIGYILFQKAIWVPLITPPLTYLVATSVTFLLNRHSRPSTITSHAFTADATTTQ